MPDSMPRLLRKVPTDAEKKLWSRLRQHQLGCKFRRQHPTGGYIADFACVEHRLIVEADGGQHADNPNDLVRTQRLEALGWRVLRFWNNDIMSNADGVVEVVLQALQARPSVTPLPR
jgi:very-short-patch-repair endonuclease